MATVYSLVCWGGKDGKTVTMTIASPCVVSLANHGLRDGTGVVFSTTGALPTGITAGTTYYSRSTATGTFNLYDTAAHAIAGGSTGIVNTSGSQSGTHTAKGAYYSGLTAEKIDKYTRNGTVHIYASLVTWTISFKTWTNANSILDSDLVVEFGEAFTDINTGSSNSVDVVCQSITFTSKIDGARTAAWHSGNPNNGYKVMSTGSLSLNAYYILVDGLHFASNTSSIGIVSTGALGCYIVFKNNIIEGSTSATNQKGLTPSAPGEYYNNIVFNIGGTGILVPSYGGAGSKIYNNLVCKCTVAGIGAETATQCYTYNNISVGNTLNWSAQWPSYIPAPRHSHNFGEAADKRTVTIDYATNANNINLTTHGRNSYMPITFTTTGALPTVVATGQPLVAGKVYYVKTRVSADVFTIADSPATSASVIAFSDNGTGTHYAAGIWSYDGSETCLDITTNSGNDVFVDYANNDFRPACSGYTPNASALQVNGGMVVPRHDTAVDMLGDIKPNYESATFPNNLWDAGPFEFDHGEGLAPSTVNISITGMASGSEIAIYKASDMSEILAPQSTTGSYSGTYTYTGDTNIIVRVRKGTSATRYLPYEYAGTITSTGFQLVVSQIPDTIAQ